MSSPMQPKPTSAFASVPKEKIFFPNLDGLRFISFFLVNTVKVEFDIGLEAE